MSRLIQWNLPRLRELYFAGVSQTDIAREFGVTQRAVWGRIHRLGWERFEHTGPPICRTCFCGAPVWKRRYGIDSERDPRLSGTRCLQHQREYEREKVRHYRARKKGIAEVLAAKADVERGGSGS